METQTIKYLYNHTSPENAYVVDGYPWGFRLRTQIRYWIETSTAKNGGQRFCSQTINPKTGKWCAPKKSTYSPIVVMFLDENEHVKYTALNLYSDKETIFEFKETHLANLDEFQKQELKRLIAYSHVMEKVTVTVELVKEGEAEQRRKDHEQALININKAIAYHAGKVVL